MKHITYLNTDNIIITNTKSQIYQEFIDDVRGNKIDMVRMMEWKEGSYICYKLQDSVKWLYIEYQQKSNDFYITIWRTTLSEELQSNFVPFIRDEKINAVLSQLQ